MLLPYHQIRSSILPMYSNLYLRVSLKRIHSTNVSNIIFLQYSVCHYPTRLIVSSCDRPCLTTQASQRSSASAHATSITATRHGLYVRRSKRCSASLTPRGCYHSFGRLRSIQLNSITFHFDTAATVAVIARLEHKHTYHSLSLITNNVGLHRSNPRGFALGYI